MRVERQAYPAALAERRTGGSQANTFPRMLNQKAQDVYVPRTETPSATEILPSDSSEVKMSKLAEIAAQADYTGMSYEEIYNTIWNRYSKAFDGNLTGIHGNVGGPGSWAKISNQLTDELVKNIVYPMQQEIWQSSGRSMDYQAALKEASGVLKSLRMKCLGYEGMSFDEIEASIQKKYAGQNTTLAYLNMQGELSITGCLENRLGKSGESTYQGMLLIRFEEAYNPNNPYENRPENGAAHMSDEQWERVANEPFDSHKLAGEMKEMLKHITFDYNIDPDNIEDLLLSAIERFAVKD